MVELIFKNIDGRNSRAKYCSNNGKCVLRENCPLSSGMTLSLKEIRDMKGLVDPLVCDIFHFEYKCPVGIDTAESGALGYIFEGH